jgi:outer membrane protein OmpU
MRKLLLGTTALAAAATLSANAVLASPSISGAMEWTYESRDPGTAGTATGASNDDFSSDTNIKLSFENKTDTGLTVGLVYDMESIGDDNANNNGSDENYMYIKGGFGTIMLGQNDGAGDQLTRTAHDLVGPDAASDNGGGFTGAGNLADDNADLVNDIGDENNITYMLPPMGGLSVGVSYKDAGETSGANADETSIGVKYAFTSGAVKGSLHYGNNSISGATAGAGSMNSDTMGVDISSGPFRAVMAKASSDVTTAVQSEITDYGIQYNLGNGITLAAVGTQIDENTGGETSDITTVSVKYNVASGLDAYLTYHDYDYEDGTTGTTADDDGSVTFLTIKATF